jgi:hypothetical protein
MAKRREATPVKLTGPQRERLERLWFYYGNYGPETTPGNHQFIQGLLEHVLDLRPLQTKRTPKSERPTEECERAVEAVLSDAGDSAREEGERARGLRLVHTSQEARKPAPPDAGLKEILDGMRRDRERHEEIGRGPDDKDAA